MTICKNCSTQIPDGCVFCPTCGAPVEANNAPTGTTVLQEEQAAPQQPAYQQQPVQPQQPAYQQPIQQPMYQQMPQQPMQPGFQPGYETDKTANSAKTLGIVALVFGFISPLIAWICGGIALGKVSKVNSSMFGASPNAQSSAKTGKICAIIGIVIGILNTIASAALLYGASY